MPYSGQCLCGAIRYHLSGEPTVVAVCHCVAWAMFAEASLTVTKGHPKTINSFGAAMRSFSADCGSGLFYRNSEILPNVVDVQSSTLDNPDALPPTVQMQTAERLTWMKHVHKLPEFGRYPV